MKHESRKTALASEFDALSGEYIKNEKVHQMKKYIQHGRITTFDHAVNVARMSFLIQKGLRIKADPRTLVRAALLHDYYLYDWHKNKTSLKNLHGYTHAKTASDNAKRDFGITEEEAHIIESHMWPLNITRIPKTKEAWIVCVSDKICSTVETLFKR